MRTALTRAPLRPLPRCFFIFLVGFGHRFIQLFREQQCFFLVLLVLVVVVVVVVTCAEFVECESVVVLVLNERVSRGDAADGDSSGAGARAKELGLKARRRAPAQPRGGGAGGRQPLPHRVYHGVEVRKGRKAGREGRKDRSIVRSFVRSFDRSIGSIVSSGAASNPFHSTPTPLYSLTTLTHRK